MLLVCAGPDTFQALKKAQDLERAYREKHDPSGLSVHRLSATKPLEAIRAHIGGGLFAQKTFLRGTGIMASWKKGDWACAEEAFARDADGTIVVTVEDEIDIDQETKIMTWPKSRVYRHQALSGAGFFRWAESVAQAEGIAWDKNLERFAASVEGDSWSFWSALPQWKAAKTLPAMSAEAESSFALAERYLKAEARESGLVGENERIGFFLQQARQALRVIANVPDPRMPMFARRKWQHLSSEQEARIEERFARLGRGVLHQRRGLMKEEEESLVI